MKIIRWAAWGTGVVAVVVMSAYGLKVIRWVVHHHQPADQAQAAPRSAAECAPENPCPAQISAHLDYKETYTASEEEAGHGSSHAEMTISATFTQKLNMDYNCPACEPEFDEIPGTEGNIPGSSSGSFKLTSESRFQGVPDPIVLWDHSVETYAGSIVDANTNLADQLAADGSPVIVGGAVADNSKPACKTTGNMHDPPDSCPQNGVLPAHVELSYELHPRSDRPAAQPAASQADKQAALWEDYLSDKWYGATTTKLRTDGRLSGYEVTFDGQKTFDRKGTKAEPGDQSYFKHLRVTVRIARTGGGG